MDDPGPDIAKAMRAKREAIEASGITWDEYLAARNERLAATPPHASAPVTATAPQQQPAPASPEHTTNPPSTPTAAEIHSSAADPAPAAPTPGPDRSPADSHNQLLASNESQVAPPKPESPLSSGRESSEANRALCP